MSWLDNFLKAHSKPTQVKILNYSEPLLFALSSIDLNFNIHDTQEGEGNVWGYFDAKVSILNRESFNEVTDRIIKKTIEKELNYRMKLFSIEGECFVDF